MTFFIVHFLISTSFLVVKNAFNFLGTHKQYWSRKEQDLHCLSLLQIKSLSLIYSSVADQHLWAFFFLTLSHSQEPKHILLGHPAFFPPVHLAFHTPFESFPTLEYQLPKPRNNLYCEPQVAAPSRTHQKHFLQGRRQLLHSLQNREDKRNQEKKNTYPANTRPDISIWNYIFFQSQIPRYQYQNTVNKNQDNVSTRAQQPCFSRLQEMWQS